MMYLFEVVEAFSARSEGLSAAPAQQGGDLLRELLGPVRAELRPPGGSFLAPSVPPFLCSYSLPLPQNAISDAFSGERERI